jgi:hypothetical protein
MNAAFVANDPQPLRPAIILQSRASACREAQLEFFCAASRKADKKLNYKNATPAILRIMPCLSENMMLKAATRWRQEG